MKIIDLFAGCGGLSLGFRREKFKSIAYLDWEQSCVDTLIENFGHDKSASFLCEDIQESFSTNSNSAKLLNGIDDNAVDGIIGGPPCQAYSMAGRVRDPQGMKNDYRNYLFESYISWLERIQPSFFVFENVTGMLSAKPGGPPIVGLISKAFDNAGYALSTIDKNIVINLADLGGNQNRKRVIIFGVNKNKFNDCERRIDTFYRYLENEKSKNCTGSVRKAFKGLEKLYPLEHSTGRLSHQTSASDDLHKSRFHNAREIQIFRILAEDLEKESPEYTSTESLKKLYREKVGKSSAVHKYYVLRWDQPSNLIPAHLYKDGLRHIHPDPQQARSITVREAARLQDFPDEFKFKNSQTENFKMIGNAVSPLMAEKIAQAVKVAMHK